MGGLPPTGESSIEAEPAAAAAIFGDRVSLARGYVELLGTDGVVRGLIGPRENDRLWSRHVLNSAVWHSLIGPDDLVADVGSGAGLPGIPLAIARPDLRLVLIEPLERRTVFLAEVIERLGLANVWVVRGRAERVVEEVGSVNVVTSRAVAPLGKLAGWSVPLLRVGGRMLALKGSSADDEVERDADQLRAVGLTQVQVIAVGGELLPDPTWVVGATYVGRPSGGKPRKPRTAHRR